MSDTETAAASRRPMPRWKKILLVVSVIAFVAGAGLKGYAYLAGGKPEPGRQLSSDPSKGSANDLTNSLVDGSTGPRPGVGDAPPDAEARGSGSGDALSPLLMHGGIGFFAGFCVGYALRTFFKMTALFLGAALLGYFALQYFGVLPPIDWSNMDERFRTLMASLSNQLSGFKTFVEGNLPSSAAATAGAFTGWKKN